ncbi:hypothetical protein CYMTET_9887 [Cymbomonas tetramitiformis]|uniref:Uncharacterized protein n=1 Tax=Cymbomonas tetramitiformis TaxID=36881 RepID=A0AAE0GQM8_9CHLO|nr:hypothetical protein CYMTET_9887 [Cymbomonas tetramitiformis]
MGAAHCNVYASTWRASATRTHTASGFDFEHLSSTRPPSPHRSLLSLPHWRTSTASCIPTTGTVTASRTATASSDPPRYIPPTVTPLYRVVVRDLNSGQRPTYAALALRLGKTFRDCEPPLARLAAPSPPAHGGGGRGGGGTVGSIHALGKRRLAPPVGEWKRQEGGGRYMVWDGTGMPCVTCWRLWAVTTGHLDTDGVCVYSCTAAFAPGRAPPFAPVPPAAPPPLSDWPPTAPPAPRAHSLLESPPHTTRRATGRHTDDERPPQRGASFFCPWPRTRDPPPVSPFLDGGGPPPTSFSLHQLDDEDVVDWPAFRDLPVVRVPPIQGSHAAAGTLDVPPTSGAHNDA